MSISEVISSGPDRSGAGVAKIDLGHDSNALSIERVAAIERQLDVAESQRRAVVLVADSTSWCNGLDLQEMKVADTASRLVGAVHALVARVLVYPGPTAAAISGHAFGAGAMLALACDYRVMRDDRGYLCFPEVELGLPPTPSMVELVVGKVGAGRAAAVLLDSRRMTAAEALHLGFIHAAAPEDAVITTALDLMRPVIAMNARAVRSVKRSIWGGVANALRAVAGPPG